MTNGRLDWLWGLLGLMALLGVGELIGAPAPAAVLLATPATLPAVIASAKSGDTVQLAPGSYSRLSIGNYRSQTVYDPRLTIDARQARMAGLQLIHVTGLNLRGGMHDPGLAYGNGPLAYALLVSQSAQVSFTDALVTGSIKGIVIQDSSDVVLDGLTIAGVGGDAVNVSGSTRVSFTNSTCGAFLLAQGGYHQDCYQAWKSTDLTVAFNFIRGEFQGIDDFGATGDPFNRGFVIRGNRVEIGSCHAITATSSTAVAIDENTVKTLQAWLALNPQCPAFIRAPVPPAAPADALLSYCRNVEPDRRRYSLAPVTAC